MLFSVEYFALEGFTSMLLSLGSAVNDGTRCKTMENLAHALAVFDHLFSLGKIFCSSPSPLAAGNSLCVGQSLCGRKLA